VSRNRGPRSPALSSPSFEGPGGSSSVSQSTDQREVRKVIGEGRPREGDRLWSHRLGSPGNLAPWSRAFERGRLPREEALLLNSQRLRGAPGPRSPGPVGRASSPQRRPDSLGRPPARLPEDRAKSGGGRCDGLYRIEPERGRSVYITSRGGKDRERRDTRCSRQRRRMEEGTAMRLGLATLKS
jgi:hypothetical protein